MLVINKLKPFYIDKNKKVVRMGNFKNSAKEIEYEDEKFLEVFENIKKPIDKDELISVIQKKTGFSKGDITDTVNYLIDERFIIDAEKYQSLISDKRYCRENLYFSMVSDDYIETDERVLNKKILILGLGGVGANVCSILSRAGFRNFILVDMDVVDESNLIRQFPYNTSDIGLQKTNVLKKKILSNHKDANIEIINKKIEKEDDIINILDGVDFVVCTLDKPSRVIRRVVNSVCIIMKKPVIFSGFAEHVALVGPFVVPGNSACLKCIDKELDEEPLNNVEIVPSYGPLCLLISSIVSNEIINYFYKFNSDNLIGKTLMFDFKSYECIIKEWEKNKKCELCGDLNDSK